MFQAAALHISFLSLANSALLVEQLQALMQAALWSSSLDSLDLTGCNFDGVDAQLLGDATAALTSLSLTAAKLHVKQICSLLQVRSLNEALIASNLTVQALSLPSSALDHLSLATLDLSSTPTNLLARWVLLFSHHTWAHIAKVPFVSCQPQLVLLPFEHRTGYKIDKLANL